MADSVSRWTKHGKDRAYVKEGSTSVGFVDLTSGAVHVHDKTNSDRVWRATASWAATNRVKLPMRASTVVIGGTGTRATGSMAGQQAGAAVSAASSSGGGFLSRIFGKKPDSWQIGAEGEKKTAATLKTLEPNWLAVHSVPVGAKGSDIDHVVFGPGGAYTINTKHHPGRAVTVSSVSFLLDGRKTDYIDAAAFEAERASALLSAAVRHPITVRPLIVPIAKTVTVNAAPNGVFVVPLDRLAAWLRNRPPVFTPQQVNRLYEVASRREMWNATH